MTTIFVDPSPDQGSVQSLLYRGNLVIFTKIRAVRELVDFTRVKLAEIFAPHDPEEAHLHFTPEEMARVLGEWKPGFMRLEQSGALLRAIIEEAGMSLEDTHLDLLRPRTAFPVGHLTTGIAFAFPWHRDTWYAAPRQQVNWWLPIFDLRENNAMKFDFEYFSKPIPNSSNGFDYYEINQARKKTSSQVNSETQSRPAAIDHDPENAAVLLPPVGSVLLFSGQHLHATIPNQSGRSRYSIDFRTVDRRDVYTDRGAPLVDADCTGTAIRDFVNAASGEPFDEEVVRNMYGEPPADAVLVFSNDGD